MTDKLGVMLCGHGSRNRKAVIEFANLSEQLKKRLPHYPVEFGYLEFATPIIRTGLDILKEKGVSRVLAVPGMLFAAGHALSLCYGRWGAGAGGSDRYRAGPGTHGVLAGALPCMSRFDY